MKKMITKVMITNTALLCLLTAVALYKAPSARTYDAIYTLAEGNAVFSEDVKEYKPFRANGFTIQLLDESLLTPSEIEQRYPRAYKIIAAEAQSAGINPYPSSKAFQAFVSGYAGRHSGDTVLNQEITNFIRTIELYDNHAANEQMLDYYRTRY